MLVVPNYLDRSKIHGLGVFATENIKAGSLVWEHVAGFDLDFAIDELPPSAREYVNHFGNMIDPGIYLLCGDNARFMNHSDTPNISAGGGHNFALRDINAGEEITCNYAEFDLNYKDLKKHDAMNL